jgi:hypothetical protein
LRGVRREVLDLVWKVGELIHDGVWREADDRLRQGRGAVHIADHRLGAERLEPGGLGV